MGKCIVVLDIGKTNKKLIVYDQSLHQLKSEYAEFPSFKRDGIEIEDSDAACAWFVQKLREVSSDFDIASISVTTHGATFACVDESGNLCVPVISYTNDPGKDFNERFFAKYGSPELLHKNLATANMGALANLAKGIEFARSRFPEGFAKTFKILSYPQFFAFRLCGVAACDFTSVGCHSYLFDFKSKGWSHVAEQMGIRKMLPDKLRPSYSVLGRISEKIASSTGLSPETLVTCGIHDSNASYLPYLAREKKKFILNSTGTWFVTMSPSADISFTESEMKSGVFCNADIDGNPVKTAIFMGGGEMNHYYGILSEHFGLKAHPSKFDPLLYERALKSDDFILPGVLKGTGPFPSSDARIVSGASVFETLSIRSPEDCPGFFREPEYAYALVNLSLAMQTEIMLRNNGALQGTRVFVEGGFRKNSAYCSLVSALCPEAETLLSDMQEATSLGAAMLSKAAITSVHPFDTMADIHISTEKIPCARLSGIDSYREIFLSFLR